MTIYILEHKKNEKKLINELKLELKNINFDFLEINQDKILFDFWRGKIFLKNKELKINKDDYFFTRGYGENKYAASVLALFLSSLKIKHSFNFFHHLSKRTSKYFQAWYFFDNDIQRPKTFVGSQKAILENFKIIREVLGKEFVLKGNGSKGEMVFLVKNKKEFQDKISKIPENKKEMLVVQEKINSDFDIRLLFFKNELLGGMKRFSDNFLNNFNQGGNVEKYVPNKKDLKLSKKAIKKFGMDYVAVDLMYKNGEPVIIEIQVGPWTHGLRKANNNFNLGKKIVEIIKK